MKSVELKYDTMDKFDIICGIDIAKNIHYATFVEKSGRQIEKAFSFTNDKEGYKILINKIQKILQENNYKKIIVGMEPTGHYWKCIAEYLMQEEYIKVVTVNPKKVKDSKELDDNCQTKNDKKDCLTIARLVKDARYFEPYLPDGIFADLRTISNTRVEIVRKRAKTMNRIIAIMDEYFPEYEKIFEDIFIQTSIVIMENCPFPNYINEFTEEKLITLIREKVKRVYNIDKIKYLKILAQNSVGRIKGIESAKMQLDIYIKDYIFLSDIIDKLEKKLEEKLQEIEYYDSIVSINGLGTITAGMFFAEIGDIKRFTNYRQIKRYAGLNLVEFSSGQYKSKSSISKRGRHELRRILYNITFSCLKNNAEIKEFYNYLITRKENQLKKKQAMIVCTNKLLQIIYSTCKKKEKYMGTKVFSDESIVKINVA